MNRINRSCHIIKSCSHRVLIVFPVFVVSTKLLTVSQSNMLQLNIHSCQRGHKVCVLSLLSNKQFFNQISVQCYGLKITKVEAVELKELIETQQLLWQFLVFIKSVTCDCSVQTLHNPLPHTGRGEVKYFCVIFAFVQGCHQCQC